MVRPTRRTTPKSRTTTPAPADRHYYIADEHSAYCVACGLPAGNRRHATKAA